MIAFVPMERNKALKFFGEHCLAAKEYSDGRVVCLMQQPFNFKLTLGYGYFEFDDAW